MKLNKILVYVVGAELAALFVLVAAGLSRPAFPSLWGVSVLLVVGFFLQVAAITTRGGKAEGSLSFVVHLTCGILFGPFWGGITTALSTAFSQLLLRKPILKAGFNIAQRTLAVVIGLWVYTALGGTIPPAYLLGHAAPVPALVVLDVLAFFAAAVTYFVVNTLLVNGAVAITTGQSVRQLWATTSGWVIGYDIAASSLALLVAWLYLRFDGPDLATRLGFLAFVAPLILAKHVYAKLNTLQTIYDELDRAHDKLELSLREQLEMMVKSIEARDPYTSGHSRRVSALSRTIARDLGLAPGVVEEIETAALLHDVGKIHAEFAPLLQKDGRLTNEEWEIMKTHASKSAELVGLFTRFRGSVQNAVRSHHERWDGKGYPDGLAGEEIPLGARIIMISDTVDAMTTDRPYRKALPFEKVVNELHKYRGIQFDSALVDVVVNSVTVRRLVSDKEYFAEQSSTAIPRKESSRPRAALRSQASFLEAFRTSATSKDS